MRIISYLANTRRVEREIRKEFGILPTHIEIVAAIRLAALNSKAPTAKDLGETLCCHKQHMLVRCVYLIKKGFVERYHTSLKASNFGKLAPGYGDAYVYSLTYRSIDMLERYQELMDKFKKE